MPSSTRSIIVSYTTIMYMDVGESTHAYVLYKEYNFNIVSPLIVRLGDIKILRTSRTIRQGE